MKNTHKDSRRIFLQNTGKVIASVAALGGLSSSLFALDSKEAKSAESKGKNFSDSKNKGANMNTVTPNAKANLQKLFGNTNLPKEDLEFFTNYANFAFDEVFTHSNLEEKQRLLLILAALSAIPAKEEFETMLKAALNAKVEPVAIKEVIYQATPYVGMAKVADILSLTNKVFRQRGIKLPLANQGTTTRENRYEKGLQAQVEIFGEGMRSARDKAPKDKKHISEFLSSNCFGDYYTRRGLDLQFRELLTFVYLVSMGGAEPQVKAHVQGNLNMGNDRAKLIAVVTALIPYIGYPRSLNALNAIDEVAGNRS